MTRDPHRTGIILSHFGLRRLRMDAPMLNTLCQATLLQLFSHHIAADDKDPRDHLHQHTFARSINHSFELLTIAAKTRHDNITWATHHVNAVATTAATMPHTIGRR